MENPIENVDAVEVIDLNTIKTIKLLTINYWHNQNNQMSQ